VDPSACKNEAIIVACKVGHLDIMEILLSDKRVDPSDQNNQAIGWASS
jgi:hypothetical protein